MSHFTADQYIGGHFVWFTGVVEDRMDPEMMGRVRVRCFGFHTDSKSLIKTEDLPWATVLLPNNSASISGVGVNPQLVPGTWVVGFFRDGPSAQDPIVMGSIASVPGQKIPASKGFSDPNGEFPRYVGEPDIPKRSREINTTPRATITASGGNVKYTEPPDQYAAKYPYNHMYQSESGHILEFDDTPGAERINIEHNSGSFVELHKNGDIRIRSTGNQYNASLGGFNVYVEKDAQVIVKGNMYARVSGETHVSSERSVTVETSKNMTLGAMGDVDIIGWNVRVSSSASGRIDLNYEPEVIEVNLSDYAYGEPIFASPGGGGTAGAAPGGTYAGSATELALDYQKDEPLPAPTALEPVPTPTTGVTVEGADHNREDLGAVSSKYESNGSPAAIGWDSTGGASWGEYQIASKTGTFRNFMKFLSKRYPGLNAKLEAAGGAAAAVANPADETALAQSIAAAKAAKAAGEPTPTPTMTTTQLLRNLKATPFAQAWVALSKSEPDFKIAQHDFIKATHYDPLAKKIKTATGVDINDGKHSAGFQDAIWSIGVQHGPGSSIPIKGMQAATGTTDADYIKAIYAERSNVDKYFSRSTQAVKDSVAKRYTRELRDCLALAGGDTTGLA